MGSGRTFNVILGEILINGIHAARKDLAARACFIGESYYPSINSRLFPRTVRSCLLKALETSPTGLTLDELTEKFHLTPERFNRPPTYIQHPQSWYLSAAIAFAAGKEVFCFPYLTGITLSTVEKMQALGLFDLLRANQKIVFLPSTHRDRLASVCDLVTDVAAVASTER